MFFKPRSILYLITLSFVSFVFVSCNLKIGEQPYRTDNIDLKPRPCTKELATRTKKYFYGELEKEDSFESISSCVNRGLDNFLKIYEADQPNYYSPIKLSNFLHRYYLKDQKISENLLEEIMNIKKVLFGGSNLMISKSEIQNLQKLIEIVGYHAKQLRPFMPILSQKVDELSTDEHLKEGFRRLRVAAKDLISILSLSKSSYQFGHFAHLLDELRMFFQWDKAFEKTKSIYDWMYLVETIKLNMIGEPAESLSAEQWEPFVDAIIDSYEIYVYYHYFIRSKPFYKGKLLPYFHRTANISFSLLERAIGFHAEGLSIERLFKVVDGLKKLDLLPTRVSLENFEKSIKPILDRTFGEQNLEPKERKKDFILTEDLEFLKTEYNLWHKVQDKISLIRPLNLNIDGTLSFRNNPFQGEESSRIESVLRSAILYRKGYMGVVVDDRVVKRRFSLSEIHHNAFIQNCLHTASRLAIRAYANNLERAMSFSGLNENELQALFEEFKPLGVELAIVHPDSYNSGSRSFLEGNLFTFSGDGIPMAPEDDDVGQVYTPSPLLSEGEISELMGFLISTSYHAKQIYADLQSRCPQKDPKLLDKYGKPLIERSCFKNFSRSVFLSHLMNLPQFSRFLAGKDFDEWNIYLEKFLLTTQLKHHWQNQISYSQIVSTTAIFHYISSLMAKYDLNGDLTLEYSELKLAFSHFGGMIQGVARSKDKDLDHEDLEKLFFILLNKGELPGGWTFYRWGEDDSKKVRVGYSELSTTLTTIAEIIKQGNQPKE